MTAYIPAGGGGVLPPATIPSSWASSAVGVSIVGAIYYYRNIGQGPVSNFNIRVFTQSGNICISICSSSGGLPSSRIFTTGLIPCPAAGVATIPLGTTLTLNQSHFFALQMDNTIATVLSVSGTPSAENMNMAGYAYFDNANLTIPVPVVVPTPNGTIRGGCHYIGTS